MSKTTSTVQTRGHEIAKAMAQLLRHVREQRGLSRGQIARKLKTTPTVVYNLESNRSRITLSDFVIIVGACGQNPARIFASSMMSVRGEEVFSKMLRHPPKKMTAEFVGMMRERLGHSQRDLARLLGYASASMIHHFEKGLREASIVDIILMMEAAHDNTRQIPSQLGAPAEICGMFLEGSAMEAKPWDQYWAHPWIAAMRQIMRSDFWYELERYETGWFADLLGISIQQERLGLRVLSELGAIKWSKAKPAVVPEARILVPQDIQKNTLDEFKSWWITKANMEVSKDGHIRSVDLLPANEEIFEDIKRFIRETQDKIHRLKLANTDGFVVLGWLGGYWKGRLPRSRTLKVKN